MMLFKGNESFDDENMWCALYGRIVLALDTMVILVAKWDVSLWCFYKNGQLYSSIVSQI